MTFRCSSLYILKLMLISSLAFAEKAKVKSCTGIEVNKIFHKKEVIDNGIDRPYKLAFFENSIYFSYNTVNDSVDTFAIGHLKEKGDRKTLENITNGFAIAIDEDNKIAYFGGSDGIYEADLNKSSDIKHVIEGYDIWDMFFYKHLYFIVYPDLRLYKRVESTSEPVNITNKEIYHFVVDSNEDTFFATNDGIYQIKNGTTETINYDGQKLFRAITVDRKGKAYFCGTNGIYVANERTKKLEEIAHIKDIFGLTFDVKNNMVYSDPHEIVRLLPEKC